LLNERRSGLKIRWDRAYPGFCQHQKSWLIDAGAETETAFVGGINLNPHSMVAPVAEPAVLGGPRTMMMSNIASPWRYENAAFHARDPLEHATACE
jgi:phosphatidylserine/phosphatidylglycerophosphate/cardiolipin synthase-like enzyme